MALTTVWGVNVFVLVSGILVVWTVILAAVLASAARRTRRRWHAAVVRIDRDGREQEL